MTPLLETLRWLRVVGDGVFLFGAGCPVWLVLSLWTGHSCRERVVPSRGSGDEVPFPEGLEEPGAVGAAWPAG